MSLGSQKFFQNHPSNHRKGRLTHKNADVSLR